MGKKKSPMYQIVAADSRAKRDGRFLEILGRYEPMQNPIGFSANEARVLYWLKNGALPTDTVRSLFQRSGLWLKWHMTKKGADDATMTAAMEKFQMARAEKAKREEERKSRRSAARKAAKATTKSEAGA